MPADRLRYALLSTRGQETWVCELDVVSVTPITTKQDGRRCLIVKMQGPEGQPEIWLEDTPEARRVLNMRPSKDDGDKRPKPRSDLPRGEYGPRHETRDWNEGDQDDRDEIPF